MLDRKEFLTTLGLVYSENLKSNATEYEIKFCKILDKLGILYIFQHPVISNNNLYILDFYLPNENISIEIDSKQYHSSKEQIKADNQRSRHLKKDGFHIVRLWNSQVSRYTEKEIKEVIDNKLKMLKDLNKIK